MKDLEKVTDAIAQAFKGSRIPRTNRELAPMGVDADDVIRHFLGKTREQVEEDFEYHLHMENYSYMTPMGVEYYLPPVLRIMLRQPWDDGLWIYLFGYLQPREDGELWWNLGELSKRQLGAIEKWARFLHERWSANPPDYLDPTEAESLAKVYGKLAREKSPLESNRRTSRPS
jgi:hypothetical protein